MSYDNWKLANPPEYDNDDEPEEEAPGPCTTCNGERVVITKGDGSEVEHCPDCVETEREADDTVWDEERIDDSGKYDDWEDQ